MLAELAWVLAAAYQYDRGQIAAALRALLSTPPFVVARRAEVLAAIDLYEDGPADFSDSLILSLARAEGCTVLLTFDRDLARSSGAERP